MNQLSLVCLSLTPNLRCVGFTLGQFTALIIPPAIEAVISLCFIYLHSGPGRWAQILLAADGILYFIWALLDMLSHAVPAARNSLSTFEALDFLVASMISFLPFLATSNPYLEISLPILLVIAVALNEVSSFVGAHLGITTNHQLIVEFSIKGESLWLSLSQSSLAIYTIIQFLFFLLAFSRLSKAFLDQRRIELVHSDEHHFFHGIAWINAGIMVGVIETIVGFARASFGVALARRILRLIARTILMFGLLKGLDVSENFENLADELRGVSRIGKRISHMLGINPRRTGMFRRISQTYLEQSQADERSLAGKQTRDQRVTVHYEKGRAPLLQIRFSALDFPAQAILTDMIQQRRRSLSGLIPGRAGGSSTQQHGKNISDEMVAARNAVLETSRAKSVLMVTGGSYVPPDWIRPPEEGHTRQGSGGTVSDSLSVVRDLERRFPNLPPRVTGKYRGSILGQNYEEDPFPVVGVSRQSSLMRHDGSVQNLSEEGGASVTLSSSGSIKRKPAPPLLDNITYISDQRKRPASTWGGLTHDTVNHPPDSPMVPNSPWESTTIYGSDPALAGKPTTPTTPTTPRLRKKTARNLIKRASRALSDASDASVRSAEWFASASSPQPTRTPLTATDIEMYRRGGLGPGSARPKPAMGEAGSHGEHLVPSGSRRSAEDARAYSKSSQPRVSIGSVSMRTTPTFTPVELEPGSERTSSLHSSVNLLGEAESQAAGRQAIVMSRQQKIDQMTVSS